LACAEGRHIKSAELVCRKAGKEQQEFLDIKFTDLLVSSFQTGGSGHSDIIPTDQVSLNFAKIEVSYKPQKADGTLDAAVKAVWDVKANKKVYPGLSWDLRRSPRPGNSMKPCRRWARRYGTTPPTSSAVRFCSNCCVSRVNTNEPRSTSTFWRIPI